MPGRIDTATWGRALAAGGLALLGTACAPSPSPVTAGPIPQGQARIWFYRVWEPSISVNAANVMLNGAPAGTVMPYGPGLYRDVAPGHYHVSAESYRPETAQTQDIDVAAGQEVFIKVVATNDTSSDGDIVSFRRDNFYVWWVAPELARQEIAAGRS
jgi:hypothetical protein